MRNGGTYNMKTNWAGRLTALLLACLLCAAPVAQAPAATEAVVTLTVRQAFTHTGNAVPPGEMFYYLLTPAKLDNPMPSNNRTPGDDVVIPDFDKALDYAFAITGNGKADIGPIRFTEPGTYSYKMRNIPERMDGYDYDTNIYTVDVLVSEDLTPTIIIQAENGSKVSAMEFAHSYDINLDVIPTDPGAMVDPPVVKTVSGSPSAASIFSFRLIAGNRANPMPAGSVNGVKTLRITGAGRGDFGTWAYTEEGTYFYTVAEVNTGVNGYAYDTTVYTITDTVRAVGGQLVLTRVVTNDDNRPVSSMSFINVYQGGTTGGGPGGSGGSPGKGPKTGDDSQVTLYTVLLCVASVAALGSAGYLFIYRRRGKGGVK